MSDVVDSSIWVSSETVGTIKLGTQLLPGPQDFCGTAHGVFRVPPSGTEVPVVRLQPHEIVGFMERHQA